MFKVKKNSDGSVARLVAQGFSQTAWSDYHETFSLVVKANTVQMVLAIAVSQQWCIHQIDVNNAFLDGKLYEEVYMKQPPGFEMLDPEGNLLVCKLKKSLYGLKQAPHAWFDTLKNFLTEALGFQGCKADSSLFFKKTLAGCVFLLFYVDDILVIGAQEDDIVGVMQALHQ